LEVTDGYVRPKDFEPISLGLVDRLFSGGWLNTHAPNPYPNSGKPGYGTRLIINSPGPAWWSEHEAKNTRFLAERMERLATANMDLQKALDESARKFNRSMRIIAVSALIIAMLTLAPAVVSMGVSLNWW